MQENMNDNVLINLDIRSRQGWKTNETELLWKEVKKANDEKRSLKSAFDSVAKLTGRKPNSIRNYYYMKVKDTDVDIKKKPSPFKPFCTEEIKKLVKTVLTAQGNGQSVRSCTLHMGNGDKKKMLRYQNKYRSIVKNNRQFVEEVMRELSDAKRKFINPYIRTKHKAGMNKAQKNDVVETVSVLVNNIIKTGVDIEAFFKSLNNLASLAAANKNVKHEENVLEQKVKELKRELYDISEANKTLSMENETLIKKIRTLVKENEIEKEKSNRAVSMFREILRVNREFLGLNPVTKVSGLSEYIQDLTIRMQECESLVNEQ